jgi:hypothetical protein
MCDMAQRVMRLRTRRKLTDCRQSVCLFATPASADPWDHHVPSHVHSGVGCRKNGAILETGVLVATPLGQATILVYVKLFGALTKCAQQRMLRRIYDRRLLGWQGVDSALSIEGIR